MSFFKRVPSKIHQGSYDVVQGSYGLGFSKLALAVPAEKGWTLLVDEGRIGRRYLRALMDQPVTYRTMKELMEAVNRVWDKDFDPALAA